MSLRWKRVNHWKNIRALVSGGDAKAYAYIQRGRRPNEYTIVFPDTAYIWALRGRTERAKETYKIPDYVLTESSLAIAKAIGMLIIKTQGEVP
jgi:hypothetical protein